MFSLSPAKSCPVVRIGHLTLNPAFPKCQTPACFQYTRTGCVPHLSWDLVSHVQDDDTPILTSISGLYPLSQQLQTLQMDVQQFCRMPHRPVFLCTYDSTTPIRHGANNKNGISFRRDSGLSHMDGQSFLSLVSNCRPQGLQSLCDADTPIDASNKRISHSVTRSLQYLDDFRQKQENGLKSIAVFGSIVGGYDLKSRLISCSDVMERKVDGFVIDGLHDYNPLNSQSLHPDADTVLQQVLQVLPVDGPKAIFGCLKPETMFHLMKLGIDIFDSSYATMLTESGKALLIRVSQDHESNVTVESETMDLIEERFKEDMSPISSECECYACRKSFTRAYINHLLVTKEMLSSVLLNLHNLFTIYQFFRTIRSKCS